MSRHRHNFAFKDTINTNRLEPLPDKGESFPWAAFFIVIIVGVFLGLLAVVFAPLFSR